MLRVAQEPEIPRIDTSVPHPARVYDYWLGGKDNFEADRAAGEAALAAFPQTVQSARANRAFLSRIVSYLAGEAGIRQFLDIGAGLPTAENVHEVAQSIAPDSRVVYVDNDPIVMLHAQVLLTSQPEGATGYVEEDLRNPESILRKARRILDFTRPTAVLLFTTLHFIPDPEDPHGIVRTLMDAVPDGSYLAISHVPSDMSPELLAMMKQMSERNPNVIVTPRDHATVTSFFDGLELVEPGVVEIARWRPRWEGEANAPGMLWGGLARK
jgi:hypothetical protein